MAERGALTVACCLPPWSDVWLGTIRFLSKTIIGPGIVHMSSRRILQTLVLLALLASPQAVEAQARTDIRAVTDRLSFPQTLKYPVAGTVTPTQGHSLSFGRTSRYPTFGTVMPVQEDSIPFFRMFNYTLVGAVIGAPAVMLGVWSLEQGDGLLTGLGLGAVALASVSVGIAARKGGASGPKAVEAAFGGTAAGVGAFLLSIWATKQPVVYLTSYILVTAATSAAIATR